MNQELEQYLWFFIDYRQKDWPEWLAIVKFAVNNKTYLATKMSLFIVNYGRELRMRVDIRRKRKLKKRNRVCKKNKEGSERGWSSIKKSSGGNEAVSR